MTPNSASVWPTAFALMPTRCNADVALGDAYRTRESWSRTMAPSPTRGATLESATRPANGKLPRTIISAKRSNISKYVRSNSPG